MNAFIQEFAQNQLTFFDMKQACFYKKSGRRLYERKIPESGNNNLFIGRKNSSTFLKFLLIAVVGLLSGTQLFSQVKGISYTLSPSGEYIFSHKNSGMANSFAIGGQLGFGFGEYIQLNANYVTSFGAKTDLNSLLNSTALKSKDVSLSRLGGEFKANLGRKRVVPFLALGTGVQTLSTDNTPKNNQIYLTSGAGLNFRLDDRIVFGLEVLNTSYRLNAANTFLTASEKASLPASALSNSSDIVSDISAKARIAFFLGGKRPGTLSDLDLAYLSQFSNGFKGLSVALEPTVMRVDFNDKLPFTDAWYAGLSTGFDFGPYVGIRAFYLNSLEDGSLTSFGKSTIWGGETKFKLNSSQGMIPYLTLGGGRIDARSGYQAPNGLTPENKAFAMGGIGIEMPLSRNIKIGGFAKGLMTTVGDVNDLSQPEDIVNSMAYGLKIGFLLGKKSESAQAVFDKKLWQIKEGLTEEQAQERERIIADYEAQLKARDEAIQQKEAELLAAKVQMDTLQQVQQKKAETLKKKEAVKVAKKEVETKILADTTVTADYKSVIRVTPEELVSIIREIKSTGTILPEAKADQKPVVKAEEVKKAAPIAPLKKIEGTIKTSEAAPTALSGVEPADSTTVPEVMSPPVEAAPVAVNDSIAEKLFEMQETIRIYAEQLNSIGALTKQNNDKLESLIALLKEQMGLSERMVGNLTRGIENQEESANRLSLRIGDLEDMKTDINDISKQIKKIDEKVGKLEKSQPRIQTTAVSDGSGEASSVDIPSAGLDFEVAFIRYSNASVFGGLNLGENNSFNVGLKWKYEISGTDFAILPETYVGIGASAYFGLFVNGTYDLNLGSENGFSPYVGTGLGVMKTKNDQNDDVFKAAHNLIIGSQLPKFSNGRFYVDFTIRNLFKYNQLTLGYNLPF